MKFKDGNAVIEACQAAGIKLSVARSGALKIAGDPTPELREAIEAHRRDIAWQLRFNVRPGSIRGEMRDPAITPEILARCKRARVSLTIADGGLQVTYPKRHPLKDDLRRIIRRHRAALIEALSV